MNLNVLNIYCLFPNFFDVGKTSLQLLCRASLSARAMLCSSMLEISIWMLPQNITAFFDKYLCRTRHVFLH